MNRKERQKKLFEKLEKYGPPLQTKCRLNKNALGDFLIPFLYHVESFVVDILKEERASMVCIEILVKNTQGKEFIHKFELPFPMYENMSDSDIKIQYRNIIKAVQNGIYLKKPELSKAYINLKTEGELEILKTNSITICTYIPEQKSTILFEKMKEYGFNINLDENTLDSIEKLEKFIDENYVV